MLLKTLKVCLNSSLFPRYHSPLPCFVCSVQSTVKLLVQSKSHLHHRGSLHSCTPLLYEVNSFFLFDTIQSKMKYSEHFHSGYVLTLPLDIIFGIGMDLMKMSQPYRGILSNQRRKKSSCLYLMSDPWTICSPRFVFNINCGFVVYQFNKPFLFP